MTDCIARLTFDPTRVLDTRASLRGLYGQVSGALRWPRGTSEYGSLKQIVRPITKAEMRIAPAHDQRAVDLLAHNIINSPASARKIIKHFCPVA